MIDGIRKSVVSVFYDRIGSPFWGTLISTWIVWNWKIIVLLLAISESALPINQTTKQRYTKIDYIIVNYSSDTNLYWGPLLSTAIIITVIPFLANGAYWITLRFRKWRLDQKHNIEDSQMLTVEESLEIRTELKNKEAKFYKLLQDKDDLIAKQQTMLVESSSDKEQDQKLIEQYKSNNDQLEKSNGHFREENHKHLETIQNLEIFSRHKDDTIVKGESEIKNLRELFKQKEIECEKLALQCNTLQGANAELQRRVNNLETIKNQIESERSIETLLNKVLDKQELKNAFNSILSNIQKRNGSFANSTINPSQMAFYEGNSLIEQVDGKYIFTPRGKEFLRQYSEKENNSK